MARILKRLESWIQNNHVRKEKILVNKAVVQINELQKRQQHSSKQYE